MPLFVRWREELEVLLLRIAPEILGAAVDGTGARASLEEGLAIEDGFIAALVEAMCDDVRARHPAGRMYGETLAIALAVHLLKQHPGHRGGLGPVRLRRVLDYIDANLQAHLSLQDLAVVVETSVFHFVRSFRESIGLPPHQYLLRRRVERAKQLLVDPRMSLVDVALRCGFASQSHLTAAFHRLARITPRDYRKGRPDGSSA